MISIINLLLAFTTPSITNDEEDVWNSDSQTLSILALLVSVCTTIVDKGAARAMSPKAPETFVGKPSLTSTVTFYPFSVQTLLGTVSIVDVNDSDGSAGAKKFDRTLAEAYDALDFPSTIAGL